MKHNWPLVAAILAILSVPFGIAIYEDATHDPAKALAEWEAEQRAELERELEEYNYDDSLYDDSLYDDDDKFADVEPEPSRMPDAFFEQLGALKTDTNPERLSGELAGLRLGKAIDKSRAPAAVAWWDESSSQFENADLELAENAGVLSAIEIAFVDDGTALRALTDLWGRPDQTLDFDDTLVLWFDEDARIRRRLRVGFGNATVVIERFTPSAAFIGETPGRTFAFEGKASLVGRKLDAVRRDMARRSDVTIDEDLSSDGELVLVFPAFEHTALPTPVTVIASDSGRVDSVLFTIRHDLVPGAHGALLDRLSTKLGAPSQRSSEDGSSRAIYEASGKQPHVEFESTRALSSVDVMLSTGE